MKGLTASLLAGYKLTPYQVLFNTFRVLSCFDAVGAMEKINVSIGDVLDLYMMSYNAQSKQEILLECPDRHRRSVHPDARFGEMGQLLCGDIRRL